MKAVKVAVSTAMCDVSAAPRGAAAALRGMPAALRGVLAALRGMLAGQDTPGAWGTLGGVGGLVLYMKNFYGLELLKDHF